MIRGERTTEERDGNVLLIHGERTAFKVAYHERDRVVTAWEAYHADHSRPVTMEVEDIYGVPQYVRLDVVIMIAVNPPTTFDRFTDDEAIERDRERDREMTEGG